MECTRVNSCRTSSIPLAEFWRPANLGKIGKIFAPRLKGFDPASAQKFFEFPTEATLNGRRIGTPSMTDIMVLAPGIRMAIEGKFTEYVEYPEPLINAWMSQKISKVLGDGWTPASYKAHLHNVLKAWIGTIRDAGCTGIEDDGTFFAECMDVQYQFLHRAASACHEAGMATGTTPVLVYQVFFDAKSAEHIEKMERFKADLGRWAAALRLKDMKFLILTVPVANAAEVVRRFGDAKRGFFNLMRDKTIYEFDFDGVEIDTVLSGRNSSAAAWPIPSSGSASGGTRERRGRLPKRRSVTGRSSRSAPSTSRMPCATRSWPTVRLTSRRIGRRISQDCREREPLT
ncbi:MAG: hypothetical protein IKO40_08065 [Kiritimatiellae bacterium]|nr:hypothetical protein [Kiritimatiellia bacterium]